MRMSLICALGFAGATLVSAMSAAESVMTAQQLALALANGESMTVLIEFEPDSAALTPTSRTQVGEMAKLLKRRQSLTVPVAFRAGDLSAPRAEALQQALVAQGVRDVRVVSKAAGHASSVAFKEYLVSRQ